MFCIGSSDVFSGVCVVPSVGFYVMLFFRSAHALFTLYVFVLHSGFQYILCYVFVLFVIVLCTLCSRFPWIVRLWFPLRYSLTFICRSLFAPLSFFFCNVLYVLLLFPASDSAFSILKLFQCKLLFAFKNSLLFFVNKRQYRLLSYFFNGKRMNILEKRINIKAILFFCFKGWGYGHGVVKIQFIATYSMYEMYYKQNILMEQTLF